MATLEFNIDQWPVVFLKLDGQQTAADMEKYISSFNALYERKQPFSVVAYLKAYSADTGIVTRIGKWFKETEPMIKQYWVSNAMVTRSAGFRFLLSALYLVKPLPIPSRVCATPDEAVAFTKAQWTVRGGHTSVHWPY
jgi:hypothetical protein